MTRYYCNTGYKLRLPFIYVYRTFRKAAFAGILFAGLWLLNSCEEKPTMLGSGILPGSDHISIFSTDTFGVTSYTDYIYPTNTQSTYRPYIGSYNDPYLGTTTSGFVSQLRLNKAWKGDSLGVDSVKLHLRVTSHYGTNNNSKYLRISEISNTLYRNAAYYSDTPVDTTGDGVSVNIPALRSDTTVNDIEMTLPNSFGERLIREPAKLFHASDTAEIDFTDYFKGIYITIPSATASDPFLIGFDVTFDSKTSWHSYFIVYVYNINDPTQKDTYLFLLDPKTENARFSKVKHEFNGKYTVNAQAIDSLSYTQGIYGAFT
ncbi:MAG: DUF4270 domain-containing protein, partial [Bacteroidales bacterium]|nr:DUF4270 domain-containing protein [Bacteroidales bacterium]